jgi:DNA-binding transcriptional MerR regulator
MPKDGRTSKNASSGKKTGKAAHANHKTNVKNSGKAHARDRVANAMSDQEARAALDASDKLYYRIGEVSELTAVKAHVLRYWETEFRWMAPPKSRSKQRLYRKRDIEFVWLLKQLLWDQRYTIAGARQRIQELGVEEALVSLGSPTEADAAPESTPVPGSQASTKNSEWGPVCAALDEMRGDLVALRGALQEGA